MSLPAHPHCFIDNRYEIEIDAQGMRDLTVSWRFDEMFSESIFADYDANQNGRFEENEIHDIYNEAFVALKDYNYFLDIEVDGNYFSVESVSDFAPSIDGDCLIYRFHVALQVDISSARRSVSIMCYDPTGYILIESSPQLGISAPSGVDYSADIAERMVEFEAFGMLPVDALIITLEAN